MRILEQGNVKELVLACQKGDRQAMERLVESVQSRVFFHCRRMLKTQEDAEDAAQDILIAMLKGLDSLQTPESFWGWLYGIIVHTCYHRLRWEKMEICRLQAAADLPGAVEDPEQCQPDKILDNEATRQMIVDLVDALPAPQRMCVLLYYYDELSVREISSIMDVPSGTVKSRLSYARQSIKKGVDGYADQGFKLYGLSPLPFIQYFLQQEAAAAAIRSLAPAVLAAAGVTTAAVKTALGVLSAKKAVAALLLLAGLVTGGVLASLPETPEAPPIQTEQAIEEYGTAEPPSQLLPEAPADKIMDLAEQPLPEAEETGQRPEVSLPAYAPSPAEPEAITAPLPVLPEPDDTVQTPPEPPAREPEAVSGPELLATPLPPLLMPERYMQELLDESQPAVVSVGPELEVPLLFITADLPGLLGPDGYMQELLPVPTLPVTPAPRPTPAPTPNPTPTPTPTPTPEPDPIPEPEPEPEPEPDFEPAIVERDFTYGAVLGYFGGYGYTNSFARAWGGADGFVSPMLRVYTSSDPSVVVVNEKGEFTTLSAGTAIITASDPDVPEIVYALTISVEDPFNWKFQPIDDIELVEGIGQSEVSIEMSHVSMQEGFEIAIEEAVWSSSDTTVAQVDSQSPFSCTVYAASPGTAVITGNIIFSVETVVGPQTMEDAVSFEVTVLDLPDTVLREEMTLQCGVSQYFPAVWADPLPGGVSYTSSDPDVVTISSDGVFTTLSAGTAVLTAATPDDLSQQYELTVYVQDSFGWSFQCNELLDFCTYVGTSQQIYLYQIEFPCTVSTKSCVWSISDPSIASIGSNYWHYCNVVGVSPGTTTLTGDFTFQVNTMAGARTMKDSISIEVTVLPAEEPGQMEIVAQTINPLNDHDVEASQVKADESETQEQIAPFEAFILNSRSIF